MTCKKGAFPDGDCCRDMAHTMQLKCCKNCKKAIEGWNCQLCDACEKALKQCGHCREKFD